jgi:hypothetical protein
LDSNLVVIGNVTAGILMLQGEGDSQTPYEAGLLLEQRLIEVGHPDHTLITYPGLGHTLSPVEGMLQPMGPVEGYVLGDLSAWLKDPARALRGIAQRQQENIDELEAEITSSVEANRNLIYAVIGFAILVGMIAGLSWLRADSRGNTQRA